MLLQDGAVLGKTFTRAALSALSRAVGSRSRAAALLARAQGGPRRASLTRARPSTASTASSRTSSATSPTRRSPSESERHDTWLLPSTSRTCSPTRTKWPRCSPRTTSLPSKPPPMQRTPGRSGPRRERCSRERVSAPDRSAPPDEGQRYFEQAAGLTDEPSSEAQPTRAGGRLAGYAGEPDGRPRERLEEAIGLFEQAGRQAHVLLRALSAALARRRRYGRSGGFDEAGGPPRAGLSLGASPERSSPYSLGRSRSRPLVPGRARRRCRARRARVAVAGAPAAAPTCSSGALRARQVVSA